MQNLDESERRAMNLSGTGTNAGMHLSWKIQFFWAVASAGAASLCHGAAAEEYEFPASLAGEWELVPAKSDILPDSSVLFDSDPESVLARDRWKVLGAKKFRIDASKKAIGVQYDDAHYVDIILGQTELAGWKVAASIRANRLVVRSSRAGVKGSESMELKSEGRMLEVKVVIRGLKKALSVKRLFRRTRD